MNNTNNNISNPLNGCEVNRIPKIQFKETPKDKNASDYLEVKYPSGKKMVYSGYNVIDEPIIKEEGSMTRAQFEELYSQLSTKTEQRISDMLVAQTKQVVEIVRQSEQRVNNLVNSKINQVMEVINQNEQNRLADKAEINQKFDEFKSEIKQEINDFKVKVNQKFDNFKVEIRTEMNEFKSEIRTEINQKFDLVFVTMENNQAQTNDRLDRIEEDIKMLKSFHEEDIIKYNEEKNKGDKNSKK